jgi:Helix-turn-helix domain
MHEVKSRQGGLLMIRAHKIRLNQANCLAHAAGTSRFVFNRGPGQWKRQYEAGATLSAPALKKQFGALRAQAHRDYNANLNLEQEACLLASPR